MFGESDSRHNRKPWFGGSAPWDQGADLENYHAQSILKDAWKVKTPTLFFEGGNDVRVPPTQPIMMHRGVRATGTPTHLYIAPGEPHNYRRPANQLFKINTELAWFARYALEQPYEPFYPEEVAEAEDVDESESAASEATPTAN